MSSKRLVEGVATQTRWAMLLLVVFLPVSSTRLVEGFPVSSARLVEGVATMTRWVIELFIGGLPVSSKRLVEGVATQTRWAMLLLVVFLPVSSTRLVEGFPVSSARLVEGVATMTRRTIVSYGGRQLILLSSAHDRVRRGWGGDCLMWVLYLDPFSGIMKE